MNWQEYQDAVGELYESLEAFDSVRRNITRPDKITGQARQIDVWIEHNLGGHQICLMVDAKFRKRRLDIKDLEEVYALANSVGADRAVIVASNGWSEPCTIKASALRMDLRIFTLEEALERLIPDMWSICTVCEADCIVMQEPRGLLLDGLLWWCCVGFCRECKAAKAWCQDCGDGFYLESPDKISCNCGHHWIYVDGKLAITFYADTGSGALQLPDGPSRHRVALLIAEAHS